MLSAILANGDQNLCDKKFLTVPWLKNKKFRPIIKNKATIMSTIDVMYVSELDKRVIKMMTVPIVQAFCHFLSSL